MALASASTGSAAFAFALATFAPTLLASTFVSIAAEATRSTT
jgi:hypothetical protein